MNIQFLFIIITYSPNYDVNKFVPTFNFALNSSRSPVRVKRPKKHNPVCQRLVKSIQDRKARKGFSNHTKNIIKQFDKPSKKKQKENNEYGLEPIGESKNEPQSISKLSSKNKLRNLK